MPECRLCGQRPAEAAPQPCGRLIRRPGGGARHDRGKTGKACFPKLTGSLPLMREKSGACVRPGYPAVRRCFGRQCSSIGEREDRGMKKQRMNTLRMVMLGMLVAVGVVISPILRIEGMCPTAHLINIVCSVLLGPWYSLLCASMIGVIRMLFMGIPPLALTGAVFGAFLSGALYRLSGGKIICAVIGEIFGTGIIGSLASYPVMAFLMGREGLNAFFYTPMFLSATAMGGAAAYLFLKALSRAGLLAKFQENLGAKVYDRKIVKAAKGD